jgi:hypothetical protein
MIIEAARRSDHVLPHSSCSFPVPAKVLTNILRKPNFCTVYSNIFREIPIHISRKIPIKRKFGEKKINYGSSEFLKID